MCGPWERIRRWLGILTDDELRYLDARDTLLTTQPPLDPIARTLARAFPEYPDGRSRSQAEAANSVILDHTEDTTKRREINAPRD